MVVAGCFPPVSIYNSIKFAIAAAATAFLTAKKYTLARDMFNHAIYGYGRAPGSKITNNMITKLKASSLLKNMISEEIEKAKAMFTIGWKTVEFQSGDLLYSIQHAQVRITGKKQAGKWNITVELKDTYNFDKFSLVLKPANKKSRLNC